MLDTKSIQRYVKFQSDFFVVTTSILASTSSLDDRALPQSDYIIQNLVLEDKQYQVFTANPLQTSWRFMHMTMNSH
jgi:hypothetical protein